MFVVHRPIRVRLERTRGNLRLLTGVSSNHQVDVIRKAWDDVCDRANPDPDPTTTMCRPVARAAIVERV